MKLETQLIEVCGLYQEVASKMEIKAMPTFLLMREGAQVDKLVGANPDEIRKRTEAFIRSSRSHKMTWICEYANYIFSESLQFWIHFDVFFLMLLTLGGNVVWEADWRLKWIQRNSQHIIFCPVVACTTFMSRLFFNWIKKLKYLIFYLIKTNLLTSFNIIKLNLLRN